MNEYFIHEGMYKTLIWWWGFYHLLSCCRVCTDIDGICVLGCKSCNFNPSWNITGRKKGFNNCAQVKRWWSSTNFPMALWLNFKCYFSFYFCMWIKLNLEKLTEVRYSKQTKSKTNCFHEEIHINDLIKREILLIQCCSIDWVVCSIIGRFMLNMRSCLNECSNVLSGISLESIRQCAL